MVPLGGALLLVSFLSMGGDPGEAASQGVLGGLRAFGREQPVPVCIIAFTLIEMILWGQRHALPGAGLAGVAGRTDLPGPVRRRYEDAGGLIDEVERILDRRRKDVERALSAQEREDLRTAVDKLRDTMRKDPFDLDDFDLALGKAEQIVDTHLASWRKSELREYAESIGIAVAVALLLRAFVVEAFKIPSPSMVPTLQVGDHIFVNKSAYGPMLPWTNTRLLPHLPPHYGDVIVFQFPEKPDQDFIKRVVALPGDKLEALDGRPIINGWRPPECKVGVYRHSWGDSSLAQHGGELFVEYLGQEAFLTFFDHAMSAATSISDRKSCSKDTDCEPGLGCRANLCGDLQGPYQVKPDEVWVMGDNRHNSHDSRGWWEGKGGGVPYDYIRGRALIIWMSWPPQGMAWDRLGITVMGKPKIPPDQMAALQPAIDKCFRDRPPLSETTPPEPAR
ncbi:MAG: signal peptidase I [Polyangiaceae bacterium]